MKTGAARHTEQTCFLIMFRFKEGERLAQIVIESLRTFGGPLRDCPVWAFLLDPAHAPHALPGLERVHRLPLTIEAGCPPYPFAEKVYALNQMPQTVGRQRSTAWSTPSTRTLSPGTTSKFRNRCAPGCWRNCHRRGNKK